MALSGERTAVLVDPHPPWLEAVEAVFSKSGVTVTGRAVDFERGVALCQQLQPRILVVEPADGGVAVDPDHERVTLAPGGLEQLDVARVEQVEDAVGEHDRTGLRRAPTHGGVPRPDLGSGTQSGSVALGWNLKV